MQTDMHYYGTYAIARMAGLSVEVAKTIAFSAQYVDDSTKNDSEEHPDGGLIYGIATAHSNGQVAKNRLVNQKEQKQVWTPFHFLPGGEGETLTQKLQCKKDSIIAQEMTKNHMAFAKNSNFGPQLMGIACHVYADTFSHYGFTGIGIDTNDVDADSIKLIDVKDPEMEAYLLNKHNRFIKKYAPSFIIKLWRAIANGAAEAFSGSLGHGGVGTYPDRPYLHWQYTYENHNKTSDRDNPATFLEGCEKMYKLLLAYGKRCDKAHKPLVLFKDVKDKIDAILRAELPMQGRINLWKTAIITNDLYTAESDEALDYDHHIWEKQKADFNSLPHSAMAKELDVYKFHQAATYHRYYVLKDLLPKHDIVIF